MQITALIFDFGRVISAPKPRSLFQRYERDLGLKPERLNDIMFSSSAWQETLIGRLTEAEFWTAIGPDLGLENPKAVDAFRKRYRADEKINAGIIELLKQLHNRYKLAVLSNNPPGLKQWLIEWEVIELFEVVFCSGDEGIVKPDPSAYRITLERLGVHPEETVFIDDTLENVQASRLLGMHGHLFSTVEGLKADLEKLGVSLTC